MKNSSTFKRTVLSSLALILVLSLAACGGNTPGSAPTAAPDPSASPGAASDAPPDPASAPSPAPQGADAEDAKLAGLFLESAVILQQLANGDYSDVAAKFDDKMKVAMTVEGLKDIWVDVMSQVDNVPYEKAFEGAVTEQNGYDVVLLGAKFGDQALRFTLSFSPKGELGGLFYKKVALPASPTYIDIGDRVAVKPALTPAPVLPPAGVKEGSVRFEAQPGFPVNGTFTCPEGITGVPVVVMIPGSGPMDRDETVGPNKPFRDIAWGLAQKGIASVRFDKITAAYMEQLQADPTIAKFDIDREIVLDALGAVQWARQQPETDTGRIYLLGHSLGAMMVPEIDKRGADVKGMILMAGSPRRFWEVMADQNRDLLAKMEAAGADKAEVDAQLTLLEAEVAKGDKLLTMSDDEALKETVFADAWYMRSIDRAEGAQWIAQSAKPTLILQGGRDFQMSPEKDFGEYQKVLAGVPNVAYKLYPDLSHLFAAYSGEAAGTTDEYLYKTPVDSAVIDDIARFIFGGASE